MALTFVVGYSVIMNMNTAYGQAEEQERSPPGALGHIKKIQDIIDTCDKKFGSSVNPNDPVKDDCMAVMGAFDEHIFQLYSEFKENIDHILYGSNN